MNYGQHSEVSGFDPREFGSLISEMEDGEPRTILTCPALGEILIHSLLSALNYPAGSNPHGERHSTYRQAIRLLLYELNFSKANVFFEIGVGKTGRQYLKFFAESKTVSFYDLPYFEGVNAFAAERKNVCAVFSGLPTSLDELTRYALARMVQNIQKLPSADMRLQKKHPNFLDVNVLLLQYSTFYNTLPREDTLSIGSYMPTLLGLSKLGLKIPKFVTQVQITAQPTVGLAIENIEKNRNLPLTAFLDKCTFPLISREILFFGKKSI